MSPNLLNPVLFTVLGDAVTLAKALSSLGLALDVLGVVILLGQERRARVEEVEDANADREFAKGMRQRAGFTERDWPVRHAGGYITAGDARRLKAADLLRGTRTGFALILAGFVLQLLGTLAS